MEHLVLADITAVVWRWSSTGGPDDQQTLDQPLELVSYASARDDLWTQCLLLRNLELTVQLALQRVSVVALFPKWGSVPKGGAERAPAPAPASLSPENQSQIISDTRIPGKRVS